MAVLLPYWVVPILFVLVCLILTVRRRGTFCRRAGGYGLLAFFLSLAIGTLAIFESRSSTAAIGFIFLPILALAPGILGFLLGTYHHRYRHRGGTTDSMAGAIIIMALCTFGWVGILAFQTYGWVETRQLNQVRDREAQRQREAIAINKQALARELADNPGQEARIIEERVAKTSDRTLLLPLASNRFAPPGILDQLARFDDFGVALSALRNDNVATKTVVWVYKNHSYPDYFFSTMAGSPASPEWLLRELYSKRHQNSGISIELAGNPNTPSDIIDPLIMDPAPRVLRRLADNPSLTCRQLKQVQASVERGKAGDRRNLVERVRERLRHCTSANDATRQDLPSQGQPWRT